MYMSDTVGVEELRQNLTRYLRRVAQGERLVVTDRNRPIAELGPRRRGRRVPPSARRAAIEEPLLRATAPGS